MRQQLERFSREELIDLYEKLAHKYVAVADELRKLKEKLEEKEEK